MGGGDEWGAHGRHARLTRGPQPPSLTCAAASCSVASLRAARLGATVLATVWYTAMARTHLQRPSAALDALAIFSGSKSSDLM